jgi:hypothetical protein
VVICSLAVSLRLPTAPRLTVRVEAGGEDRGGIAQNPAGCATGGEGGVIAGGNETSIVGDVTRRCEAEVTLRIDSAGVGNAGTGIDTDIAGGDEAAAVGERPSAVTTTSPAEAPRWPALRTPTPASVPTSTILPAYMPPRLATSMAKAGAAPLPARRQSASPACYPASTTLVPAVTLSVCAQIPALTSTARAMRSV